MYNMGQTSNGGKIRFVGDIDTEPKPLRSQLWELVIAGATELDQPEAAKQLEQGTQTPSS